MTTTDYLLDFSEADQLPWRDKEFNDLLWKASLNGIMVMPKAEDCPCPWDAGIDIESDTLVLSGGAGVSGYGSCTVKVPKRFAHKNYEFLLELLEEEFPKESSQLFGWLIQLGVKLTRKELP